MKIDKYSIAKNGLPPYRKSPIIFGHAMGTNQSYPLAYLRKPRWMKDDSWDKILDAIELNITKDLELEHE